MQNVNAVNERKRHFIAPTRMLTGTFPVFSAGSRVPAGGFWFVINTACCILHMRHTHAGDAASIHIIFRVQIK